MYTFKHLPQSFFERKPHIVARDLIGKLLVRTLKNEQWVFRIIETEAYGYTDDPASHTYNGLNKRNASMFGPAGHMYVYLSYGIHYCMNFVSKEKDSKAGGVLIRALEIVSGPNHREIDQRICSGPGKLTKFLEIDLNHNGHMLGIHLIVADAPKTQVVEDIRIGISKGQDFLWRFVEKDNPIISKAIQKRL